MRLPVRVILVLTLSLSLWSIVDGVRCLVTGRYFGRVLSQAEIGEWPHALALPPLAGGLPQSIDYGAWAAWLTQLGVDPHALAPFFLALGLAGLIGLVLFLQARPIGWALLVAFAGVCALKWGMFSLLALPLLVVLWLPATRGLLETEA